MTQWVEYKHEDLCPDLKLPHKSWVWSQLSVTSGLGGRDRQILGLDWTANLEETRSSRFRERPFQKIRWRAIQIDAWCEPLTSSHKEAHSGKQICTQIHTHLMPSHPISPQILYCEKSFNKQYWSNIKWDWLLLQITLGSLQLLKCYLLETPLIKYILIGCQTPWYQGRNGTYPSKYSNSNGISKVPSLYSVTII